MHPPPMIEAILLDLVKTTARRHRVALNLVPFLALLAFMYSLSPIVLEKVRLISPTQEEVTLPYKFNANTTYVFEATLNQSALTPDHLSIQADDCVENVALDGVPFFTSKCGLCEHCNFTAIPLPKTITPGPHKVTIRAQNLTGGGLLDIRQAQGFQWGHILFVLLAGLLWFALVWRRGLPSGYGWLGVLALLLTVQYHLITDPFMRQHDVGGHREYIDVLMKTHALPTVKQGWETWQPPLYYTVGALWAGATSVLDADPFRRVQMLASLLYLLAVAVACLKWRSFGFNKNTGWVGLVLFVVMPAHVFLSARVNNDALMPTIGMVMTFLGWSYVRNSRLSTVALMSLVLLIALLTKTSSMSLIAGTGLLVMYIDQKTGRPLLSRLWRYLLMGVPSLLWLSFWFSRNKEQTGEWVYVNADISDGLKVGNAAFKFFSFDFRAFLTEPYFHTFGGKIRESFPTSLAASLLTGEFNMEWLGTPLQTFLRAVFVPMLVLFCVGLLTRPAATQERPWLPALFIFALHGFFMLSYNWRYPYACNQDARLWSPTYFPAAVLWSWGYEAALIRFSGWWRRILLVAPYVFLAVLAYFYVQLLFHQV